MVLRNPQRGNFLMKEQPMMTYICEICRNVKLFVYNLIHLLIDRLWGHDDQGSVEFTGMSNWFCNQAVCGGGGVCAVCSLGWWEWQSLVSTNQRPGKPISRPMGALGWLPAGSHVWATVARWPRTEYAAVRYSLAQLPHTITMFLLASFCFTSTFGKKLFTVLVVIFMKLFPPNYLFKLL